MVEIPLEEYNLTIISCGSRCQFRGDTCHWMTCARTLRSAAMNWRKHLMYLLVTYADQRNRLTFAVWSPSFSDVSTIFSEVSSKKTGSSVRYYYETTIRWCPGMKVLGSSRHSTRHGSDQTFSRRYHSHFCGKGESERW